jgi:hypothetical protein
MRNMACSTSYARPSTTTKVLPCICSHKSILPTANAPAPKRYCAGSAAAGEWIAPPRILDAIDRLGMRQTFNRWLLHQATQIQLQLAEQGIDIVLSINLSANDLLDIELPDMIGQVLATWDIAPDRILLEITETIMVDESWQVLDVLNRMRKLGLHLSIDDFGTGYAGLSYLQRLPVQEVKIDQMFVRQAAESEKGTGNYHLDHPTRDKTQHERHCRRGRNHRNSRHSVRARLPLCSGIPLLESLANARVH